MTQEDKELLLKDISGRLPYYPIVQITLYRNSGIRSDVELDPHVTENIWEMIDKYHALPYLRPMSSMTEEEKEEIKPLFSKFIDESGKRVLVVRQNKMALYQDYLNAHHFDYRGLIPKDLAIEVTKENNPYEEINM